MSRRRKGFSPQFERDYLFYLSNKDLFTFAGTDIKRDYRIQYIGELEQTVPFSIPYHEQGKSAKVCFYQLDSEGKCKPCAEPELLVQILTCKAAVNLQIKMWAEGRAEYTLSKQEMLDILKNISAPEWVFKAIENQKSKILKQWVSEKIYHKDFYKLAFTLHLSEILEDESVILGDVNNQ